jgi:hypothetical protein
MAPLHWLVVLLLLPLSATAGDLKITTVRHYSRVLHNRTDPKVFPDQDWERTETVYVHGPMQRFEFGDAKPFRPTSAESGLSHVAEIANCETRESMRLDLEAGEYIAVHWPSDESMHAADAERLKRSETDWSKFKVSVDSKTVDTGETMPFLGYIAHHFVITNHHTPVGELAVLMDQHEDSTGDVWYIDATIRLPVRNCQPDDPAANAAEQARLRERQEVKHTGPTPHGFLVKMRRVAEISTRTVAYTETLETTVTELSQAPLDPRLFTAPPEYKAVTCLRGQPCGNK